MPFIFLLQNPFVKKATFQIPVLWTAKYSQQSAQVLPQRTYTARSFLASDSPPKRCLDSHSCLENSISAVKPSLQDFVSCFCCVLTLGSSSSLAKLFSLTLWGTSPLYSGEWILLQNLLVCVWIHLICVNCSIPQHPGLGVCLNALGVRVPTLF